MCKGGGGPKAQMPNNVYMPQWCRVRGEQFKAGGHGFDPGQKLFNGLDKTTNGSVIYCGTQRQNHIAFYCGNKAQAVPLHYTLSHLHSVVYLGKA